MASSIQTAPAQRAAEILGASGTVHLANLRGAARGALARAVLRAAPGAAILAIAPDEDAAESLEADLRFFLAALATGGMPPVIRVPADPVLPYDDLSPDRGLEMDRLAALCRLHLAGGSARAVVASARALARRAVPSPVFESRAELVGPGLELPRDALAAKLVLLGYTRVPLVEDPGTFAVRGGIVDVWSPTGERPVRLEYFGDAVESARVFDPEGQLTAGDVEELVLCPAREVLFSPEGKAAAAAAILEIAERVKRPTAQVRELRERIEAGEPFFGMEALLPGFHPGGLGTLFDFLPARTVAFLDDPAGVEEALADHSAELEKGFAGALRRDEIAFPPAAHALAAAEVGARLAAMPRLLSHRVFLGTGEPVRFDHGDVAGLRGEIAGAHGDEGALAPLLRRLGDWRSRGIAAVVACSSPSSSDRLRRLLEDRRAPARSHPGPFPADPRALHDPSVHAHLVPGEISAGFVDDREGLALLSDEEIFGRRVRRRARQARLENALAAAFRDLDEGDLVVHVEHGIARYAGLTKMSIGGVEGDFLVLRYQGADRLYLPVSKLRQLQKFSGAAPESIRLDRLGGTSFALRKQRVKEQLLQMAAELLEVHAARAAHPGTAFAAPDEIYREFEAEFPYEPTPDQQRAVDDVLADLAKEKARPPMDRLVCGDVGYGKTEVAMRAAMLAALSRKQVAILVPTTVLAAQHERTFRERFAGYPVRVEAVSRMKAPEQIRAVLRDLAAGAVDVVIGTHRLLGADVNFKDLGLVVVDEEQRFGVVHKERLKKLRRLVDVLTLTATPIPRTLHMSLAGVRDLSIIASPPEDRRAIRTFVVKFDPAAIREAIRHELRRGGQVFFVHNRVRSIGGMEKFLRELVPQARIGVAHGQMAERRLEEVMSRFVNRELDLLLATSIIESGLDIPGANTLIVNRADAFGLSQLYQVRGRVGRSRERAYAYLLVPARRPVTAEAVKRLEALQKFSELGAGFQIASHDLEIRGAGNLLGAEQSGHIEAVGFDLYAQLLDEAIRERRGEPPRPEEIEPDVRLPLPAFLPEGYLPDVHQRLFFYKRLAEARSDEELDEVRAEILDRYGDAPAEVDQLCALMAAKVRLRALRIRSLEAGPGRLVFALGEGAALDPLGLASAVQRSGGAWRLTPEMKLVVHLGEGGRPTPPGRGRRPRPGPPPTPAQEAAAGMELLQAARSVLADLAACARDEA